MESKNAKIIRFLNKYSFVAVALAKGIKIFECPSKEKSIEPLVLFKKFGTKEVKSFTWSPDSRYISF